MQFIRAGSAMLWAGLAADLHLCIVLTDPDPATEKVIVVMVVTERQHTDKTVTIEPGEHQFIRHRSNVDYGSAKPVPSSRLAAAIASGAAKLQPDASAALLAKVRSGVLQSPRTIHHVAEYCRTAFEREGN